MQDEQTCFSSDVATASDFSTLVTVQCAMLSALAIVLGHALAPVPNVELVTLVVFIAGYLCGATGGMVMAGTTAFYFNYLNPMGQVFIPVLFGQFLGWTLTALIGACFREKGVRHRWAFAAAGFIATTIYQLVVNVAYVALCCPAMDYKGQLAVLAAGMAFTTTHLLSNTIIFAIMAEKLIRVIESSSSAR